MLSKKQYETEWATMNQQTKGKFQMVISQIILIENSIVKYSLKYIFAECAI